MQGHSTGSHTALMTHARPQHIERRACIQRAHVSHRECGYLQTAHGGAHSALPPMDPHPTHLTSLPSSFTLFSLIAE